MQKQISEKNKIPPKTPYEYYLIWTLDTCCYCSIEKYDIDYYYSHRVTTEVRYFRNYFDLRSNKLTNYIRHCYNLTWFDVT